MGDANLPYEMRHRDFYRMHEPKVPYACLTRDVTWLKKMFYSNTDVQNNFDNYVEHVDVPQSSEAGKSEYHKAS